MELNPRAVFKLGINLNTVRNAISSANAGANSPKGSIEQGDQRVQIYANDNASAAKDFQNLIVAYRNNSPVRLSDVATVYDGQENVRNLGVANGKPAVIINVTQQPGSNVIQVVDRIKAILPELQKSLPSAIDPIVVVQDPTVSIRNSVRHVEMTLILSTLLVVLVVFAFLRNVRATMVPAVSVPLALLGTFSGMYVMGYSLNNFSLMALIISTGFVVDNAIVVLENVTRHLEAGRNRLEAAMIGTSEVAFTVISMSISLIAVFIPILMMPGIVGKVFHEFAMVLCIAIAVSMIISLSVTPMMCSFLSVPDPDRENALARGARKIFDISLDFYRRTLGWALDNPKTIMATLAVAIYLTIHLYSILPTGFFPQTDEGRLNGNIRGDQTASFESMRPKFLKFMDIIRQDPAVATVAGSLGGGGGFGGGGGANGNLWITLKSPAERGYVTSEEVRVRLMPKFADITGARAFLNSVSSTGVRAGARQGTGNYQYTVQADTIEDLKEWVPKIQDALFNVPEIESVDPDQQPGGLELQLQIDRQTAARMGLATNLISGTLGNLFSQAAVSTIYQDKNQYRVIMEVAPSFWKSPDSLRDVYVSTSGNVSGSQATAGSVASNVAPAGSDAGALSSAQAAAEAVRNQQQNALSGRAGNTSAAVSTRVEKMVPLSAFVTMAPGTSPLSVNHQGPFVATTFSYGVPEGISVGQATDAINKTLERINVPISVHGGFAGTAQLANNSMAAIPMLILAAIVIIYIVLGMLYESYIHPLTILSTLPSAGVGALLALLLFRIEFSLIAFIGVMLLIGVVKKNAIIMIDFAIQLQRAENLSPRDAIYRASVMRFRPIMMTTLGAILGALPLAIGIGEGYELRQPLGIATVGGLVVSQALTLYTTPVIYMYLDRFGSWCTRTWHRLYGGLFRQAPAVAPAE